MRYIDYTKIFTEAESSALCSVVRHLSAVMRCVPLQSGNEDKARIFDLGNNFQRTSLLESFAVIKRFHNRFNKGKSVFDPLWRLISKPLGTSNPYELEDFTSLALTVEPFCVHLEELLTGKKPKQKIYNDFFKPFREPAKGRFASILPSNGIMNRFFLTLKEVRNMVGHGKEGLPIEQGRLMVTIGLLVIVNRFFNELDELLFDEDDHIVFTPEEIANDAELQQWAQEYMDAQQANRAKRAIQIVQGLFANTTLGSYNGIYASLPHLKTDGKLTYQAGATFIVGEHGSGVTSTLARTAIEGSPCPYTVMVDDNNRRTNVYDTRWLLTNISGEDFRALSPRQIEALSQWVINALGQGKIAIIVDNNIVFDQNTTSFCNPFFAHLNGVMVLFSARPADSETMAKYASKNSRFVNMQPLSQNNRDSVLKLMGSIPCKDADLSQLIAQRLETMAKDIDLNNPLLFVTTADLIARGLCDTKPNMVNFANELHKRLGECASHCSLVAELDSLKHSVKELALNVYRTFYHGSGHAAALMLIEDSGLLATKVKARRFFEICHLWRNDGQISLLATLAANFVLAQKTAQNNSGMQFNMSLIRLALYTNTIPVDEPTNRKGNVIFRPAPKYIAERYVLNTLSLNSFSSEHDDILQAVALLSTPSVLRRLFSPRWCKALESGRFDEMLAVRGISCPIEYALMLILYFARKSLNGLIDKSGVHVQRYINTLKTMNDAQRLALIEKINSRAAELKYSAMPAPFCCNLALLTMDVPSGTRYYNTEAEVPFLNLDFWVGFAQRAVKNEQSWPLLFKVVTHVCQTRSFGLLKALLTVMFSGGLHRSPKFNNLINNLSGSQEVRKIIKQVLDSIPLSEIDESIAIGFYNPTLTDLALRNSTCDKPPTQVAIINGVSSEMLLPVVEISPNDKVQKYSYCVYSHGKGTMKLSVEPFADDNIAGRFICINGSVAGRVKDVVRIKPGQPNSSYALLKVPLSPNKEKSGYFGNLFLSLGRDDFHKKIEYVDFFTNDSGTSGIFRIDDEEAIEALSNAPNTDVSVKIFGDILDVPELTIIKFATVQTFITVEPTYKAEDFPQIPQQGLFTVHYTANTADSKFNKSPYLQMSPSPSRPSAAKVPQMAVTGFYNGAILMTYAGEPFTRGSYLWHKLSGVALKVLRSYSFANKNAIPAEISEMVSKTINALRRNGSKMPYFTSAVLLEPCDKTLEQLPTGLTKIGLVIKNVFERRWANQVFVPRHIEDTQIAPKTFACAWLPLHVVRHDDRFRVEVPYAPILAKAAYMRLVNTPFTFTARFKDTRLVLDRMLNSLFRDRFESQRNEEPFFAMFLDENLQPIVAEYDNIHTLVELAGHATDIRHEIRKMIKENDTDIRK